MKKFVKICVSFMLASALLLMSGCGSNDSSDADGGENGGTPTGTANEGMSDAGTSNGEADISSESVAESVADPITPRNPPPILLDTFPSIYITTPGSPFIERRLWQDGTVEIKNDPRGTGLFDARIRGRGNSTWYNAADKRPLRIRLDEARPLFGSAYAARDWILLANYFDDSLLRNYAALYLSREMGRMHAITTIQNVHLYVNGEYMGVYLLTDERDVIPGRLEIEWHENPAKSGFFIELCFRAPSEGVRNEDFIVVSGRPFDIRFPGGARNTPEHVGYLADFMGEVCFAIRTRDYERVAQLVDIPSFVDYYLVQELFKNSDGALSNFMYITGVGDERRLFKGPIWDMDITAGINSSLPLGRHDDQVIVVGVFSLWYRNLLEIPEFKEAVVSRWNEISTAEIPQMAERVRLLASHNYADFARNFERHDFNHHTHTFANQVDFMLAWLTERVEWLDNYFNGNASGFDPLWALVDYHANRRPVPVNFNGVPLRLTASPIVLNGVTLFPVYEFPFDVTVVYNGGAITVYNDAATITNQIGSPIFYINNIATDLIVSSLYSNGHIFVPLRPVTEALGYTMARRDGVIVLE